MTATTWSRPLIPARASWLGYAGRQNIDEPLAMRVAVRLVTTKRMASDRSRSLSITAGALANTYTYDSFGNMTELDGLGV